MTIYRPDHQAGQGGQPGCADGAGRCGWCCMVGDRFYDREAAKANETAFIGCRYGYGGSDEFGDGDLLAEDSVEIPRLLNGWFPPHPGGNMAETMAEAIGRPWGRDYRETAADSGDSINLLKKGEGTACDRMMEDALRPDRDVRLFF